jgi:hypothetical protein
LLARARFGCVKCKAAGLTHPSGELAVFFRTTPTDGGQAVPENAVVLCPIHALDFTPIPLGA